MPTIFRSSGWLRRGCNASADHRCDQRRGDIADAAGFVDDRGDQQIFGTGIHGALEDVDDFADLFCGGIGEGCFADARLSDEAGI